MKAFPGPVYALLVLVASFALAACTPPLYVSEGPSVPLHAERGDVHFGGTLSSSGPGLEGAAALTDHLGVMARASLLDGPNVFDDDYRARDVNTTQNAVVEAGLGAYGTAGARQQVRYALYGGYGIGKARSLNGGVSFFPSTDDGGLRLEGTYGRMFVQPSVGLVTDYFEAGYAMRIAYVNFHAIRAAQPFEAAGRQFDGPGEVFLEPTFTVGAGPRYLRFVVRAGTMLHFGDDWIEVGDANYPMEDSLDRPPLYYEPLLLSMGLQVRLQDVF